jgi:Xaa-Pro aminopeptidase
MQSDLDRILRERGIEAIVAPLHESMHSAFRWLSRGAKVTRGHAIKLAGFDPVLLSYPMERDEAAATGLDVRSVHDLGFDDIFRNATSVVDGYAELYARALRDLGVRESVAFAGNVPAHLYLGIAEALERRGLRVVRGSGEDLIQLARKRKEPWEIELIRSVGERTEQVIDAVRAVLREAIVDGDRVLTGGAR